jgi:ABC-2 type transport system permease protein
MNKILLIAQREFLTRVMKRTFLLSTILLPLIIFGFYALMIYFSVSSDDTLKVAISDKAAILKGQLKSDEDVSFTVVKDTSVAQLKQLLTSKQYDAYLILPSVNTPNEKMQIVSDKKIGLTSRQRIENRVNRVLEESRLQTSLNVTTTQLDSLQQEVPIEYSTIKGEKESDIGAIASNIIGYISGFLIYFILFIYGSMVMRGVMEEKVNRIAEVVVSSVRPFQLMMGKIIGIGSVGLVQFIIWFVLVFGLQLLLPLFFPQLGEQMQQQAAAGPGMMPGGSVAASSDAISKLAVIKNSINIPLVLGAFVFYFLGGYLLYASLFAAVGSAVNEDPQDAQSLLLPITMPIIFGIVIMTKAVSDPNSGIAVFGSLFPLTSPIVMMGRIAHGVGDGGIPVWQLIVSMALLIGGFIATTWLAGKIYRVGILMYGKKPTWKELMKWAFKKV